MHARALEEEVARLLSSSPPETSPAGAAADSPQSLVQRGLQAVAAQQYDSADSLFRKAYQMDPNYVAARVNLARLALARGRAQEALELLAPYRSHEGLAPNLRFILASALAELGRTDEALAELDKALSKGFSDTALLATSPYFASLRQTPAFAALLRKHYIDLSNIADRASDRATSRPLSLFPPAAVQNQATSGAASLQAPLPPPATR
jgi:tetratricopeptide (TPR) repeat protein